MYAKLIICFFLGMLAIQMCSALPSNCTLERDEGFCFGNFQRFFFNINTGTCESFTYGGCQGNGNNFEDAEACQAFCV